MAFEQQWLQGQKANNPELIAPPLADKIVVAEADGRVLDKAGILAFYKKTKWDSAEYTDVPSRPEASKGRAPMQRENLLITMSAGPTPGRRCPAVNGSVSPVMHRRQKRKQPTTPGRTGRLYLGGHHFIPSVRFPGVLPPFKRAQFLSYLSRLPSFMCFLKLCAI